MEQVVEVVDQDIMVVVTVVQDRHLLVVPVLGVLLRVDMPTQVEMLIRVVLVVMVVLDLKVVV
jgi:hypothetical protein